MLETIYKNVLKPIFFRFDPEKIHDVFVNLGEKLGERRWSRALIDKMYGYHGPDVSRVVDGIRYRTPVVLAAGFDYNGRLIRILPHIGFGGVEIGSVTAEPCEGNPQPRLQRLVRSQSLRVNKGLRNAGAVAISQRLADVELPEDFVLGVSFARTNSPQCADLQASIDDYCRSYQIFSEARLGHYYTFNISCPNVYGGENFADPERLYKLCQALRSIPSSQPIYAKMPINLPWSEFSELLHVLDEAKFQGLIIGNLCKDYQMLDFPEEAPKEYQGGISGKPCQKPSNQLIKQTRQVFGQRFTIFGCGGILKPEDAIEKMESGADLVQLITGMIFSGPQLMSQISHKVANHAPPFFELERRVASR